MSVLQITKSMIVLILSAVIRRLGVAAAKGLIRPAGPLLAQSTHVTVSDQYPLSGVKQTLPWSVAMSAFDPKRTLVSLLMALSEYTGKLLSFSVSRAR